jgi:AbrB family looped-hinge helix DNA binding protein
MPAAKMEPQPRFSARVKVRPKAQLTLPEEIRRALHISEGDEVEFSAHLSITTVAGRAMSVVTVSAEASA